MFKVIEYNQEMILDAIEEHFKRHHARGMVKNGEEFVSMTSEHDWTEYVVLVGDPKSKRWKEYGEGKKGGF